MRTGNLRDRASGTFRYTREEEFIANTSRHVAKVTVKLGAKRWSPDGSEDGFPRQHWPLR